MLREGISSCHLKKYIHSTIIFAILAIPSAIIISYLFAGPDPDDFIHILIEEHIIIDDVLEAYGVAYSYLAYEMNILLVQLQISLLLLTYIYIIILDVLGAIKISLHWLIKSAIFAIFIILINIYYLYSETFEVADFIGAYGAVVLNLYSLIYYLTMFLIILVVKNWLSKKYV